MASRVFPASNFLMPALGEPTRSVVTESPDATVVAWYVLPGQCISSHVHPLGQDTWVVLSGVGEYALDATDKKLSIKSGDIVVARRGEIHGVCNVGPEALIFVAVVSPSASGFELV